MNRKQEYSEKATAMGYRRIGRYAYSFWCTAPNGKLYKLLQVIDLRDDFITDPTAIKQAIIDDGGSIRK